MNNIHKILASSLGVGYIGRGGGSVAAALYCLVYYFFASYFSTPETIIFTILVIATGVWSSNELEADWGKDSPKIVIDEIAGMQISLLFIPPEMLNIFIAFVLFRFFDIVKPLLIRKMEKFPKGWGVMFDDVLAGIYSNIILHIYLFLMGNSS
jgi:phosphatidylglycerophosphatase A